MVSKSKNTKPQGMVDFAKTNLSNLDRLGMEADAFNADLAFIDSQARTQKIKDETALEFPEFGGGSGMLKNLPKESANYYKNVLNTLGADTLPFARIPSPLMPRLLSVMQQGGAYNNPQGLKEFIGAVEQAHARDPKEAEKFLNAEQKRLSAQNAKLESDNKASEAKDKSVKAASEAEEKLKQREVSAVQSVRDEYAGMSPDQVIAHYSSKYKTAMTNSPSSAKKAISNMDDEIDQMAASKLGKKYSQEKGLY